MSWHCHTCKDTHPESYRFCPVSGDERPIDIDRLLDRLRQFAELSDTTTLELNPTECRTLLRHIREAWHEARKYEGT